MKPCPQQFRGSCKCSCNSGEQVGAFGPSDLREEIALVSLHGRIFGRKTGLHFS
jgi:hypothetical protein